MSRTRLHARLGRVLGQGRRREGLGLAASALSRRTALKLGGAALLTACTREAAPLAAPPRIAIVGGGVAGLTAAYRLARGGHSVRLFEAGNRLGGRMHTLRGFTEDGQFCELGGELVDRNHAALHALATELGIGIEPFAAAPSDEDSFDIGGTTHRTRDMLDLAARSGAFLPMATRIGADQSQLLDADEAWTPLARQLDAMSLAEYLDTLRRDGAAPWAITLIDLAYRGEFGLPTEEQSALNLVDFIGVDTSTEFQLFGESDEYARIAGGSSALTDALAGAMPAGATVDLEHALTRIAANGSTLTLTLSTPAGQRDEAFDEVVLCLPFTRLREVEGIDALGLGAGKLEAIRSLGYGRNAKLMLATRGRPWRTENPAGTWYTDRGFEAMWETSRGQQGTGGILTNFLSHSDRTAPEATAMLTAGLTPTMPQTAAALVPERTAYFAWANHKLTLGSYASARPGQYTTLLEEAGTPELGGRLHFAGEHTSPDFLGYMNGAIDSAERVAASILARP